MTADLRCSTFVTGTPTTVAPSGSRCAVSWLRPGLVGAAAEADPDRAAVLEDVAAVEGAGRLDVHDPVAEPEQRLLGAGRLGLPLVRARAG